MRRFWRNLGVAGGSILLVITGCGGDSNGGGGSATMSGLAGMYRVQGRVRRDPCDAVGDAEQTPYPFAYFAVIDDVLVNGLFVNAITCTGPERTSCDELGHVLFLGEKVGDGEYAAGTYQRSPGADACTHSWIGARLKKTATGVVLQEEYRSEDRAAATCDGELDSAGIAKGSTLRCGSIEASTAVRL
jgi:hypothetical protein